MMAVTPSDTALGSTLQTPTSATTPRAELSAVPDGDELAAIGRSENPQPPRSGRYRTEAPMLALAPPQGKYYIDRHEWWVVWYRPLQVMMQNADSRQWN